MRTLFHFVKGLVIAIFIFPLILINFFLTGPLGRECMILRTKFFVFFDSGKDLTELESEIVQFIENIENSKFERNCMFLEIAKNNSETHQSKTLIADTRKMLKLDQEIYQSCEFLFEVAPSFNGEITELNLLLAEEDQNTENHKKMSELLNINPSHLSTSFASFISIFKNNSEAHIVV